MKKIGRLILLGLILFLLFVAYASHQVNEKSENVFGGKKFIIEKGQGVRAVAKNLREQGFIDSSFWFSYYVWRQDKALFDGEYDLRTDWSIKQIFNALQQAQTLKEETITIIEGWSVKDIDKYLVDKGLIKKGELINYSDGFYGINAEQKIIANNWDLLKDRPRKVGLEGFLYPDTYRIYRDSSVEAIVKKMLDHFHDQVSLELRAEIKKQRGDFYEYLTLASIVEKEMFGYENRRKVADVFWSRLKINMPLQSDATVNYITGKGTVRPSAKDLAVESPYNTYQQYGLPPTPICNPSLEAIKAVIYPDTTPYLYFLTTPEQQIIFSKNYDEHLQNIYKYLK